MLKFNLKRSIAAVIVAVLASGMLIGCAPTSAEAEGEAAITTSSPPKLYENSSYPGITFNETTLVFIEKMFDTGLITISSNEAGAEYTIASETMKATYGDKCRYYLSPDVISSIRDDWQTESWTCLEGASFHSDQPQIIFRDESGTQELQFWLQAKFVGVLNVNSYMIFQVSDEVVAAVQKQFDELPSKTSTRRTPEQTVELFFEKLNANDAEGLNSVMAAPIAEPTFDSNVSDKINSIKNLGHIGEFP
ncbi:MAG: hypothetical protein RSD35_07230, partial [Oscillospiraceae bacterium]